MHKTVYIMFETLPKLNQLLWQLSKCRQQLMWQHGFTAYRQYYHHL